MKVQFILLYRILLIRVTHKSDTTTSTYTVFVSKVHNRPRFLVSLSDSGKLLNVILKRFFDQNQSKDLTIVENVYGILWDTDLFFCRCSFPIVTIQN